MQGNEGRDQEGGGERGETGCPCFQRRWDVGFEDLPVGMKGHSLVHTSVPRERSRSLFPNMLSRTGGASLLSFFAQLLF